MRRLASADDGNDDDRDTAAPAPSKNVSDSSFVVDEGGNLNPYSRGNHYNNNIPAAAFGYFIDGDGDGDDDDSPPSSPDSATAATPKKAAPSSPASGADSPPEPTPRGKGAEVMGRVGRNISKLTRKIRPQQLRASPPPTSSQPPPTLTTTEVPQSTAAQFVRSLFDVFTTSQTTTIPQALQTDDLLKKQLAQLRRKLENEMDMLKSSYELAKQQLVAEAQLRNSLPFDVSELMKQAAKKFAS